MPRHKPNSTFVLARADIPSMRLGMVDAIYVCGNNPEHRVRSETVWPEGYVFHDGRVAKGPRGKRDLYCEQCDD